MQQNSSRDEMDYVRRRNASRPTVIYFHGLLNKEVSKDRERSPDLFFEENDKQIKSCVKISAAVHYGSEDGDRKEDTVRDLQCLESDECCLPCKRHRTSFTSFQLKRLEEEFDHDSYIIGMRRFRLSEELEVPEKQIKIWFQNRRTKVKKHCANCSHVSNENRGRLG